MTALERIIVKNGLALVVLLSAVPVSASAAGESPSAGKSPAAAAPAEAAPPAGAREVEAAPEPMSATLKVPLFSERFSSVPVAAVADETITLAELNDGLAAAHEAHAPGARAKGKDFRPVLDRLVDLRLLVLEARDMELDQLDDVKKAVADERELELRSQLERVVVKGIKPDPMEVEQAWREAVREWKLRSLLFAQEADAAAFLADLKAGKAFGDLARAAVAAKKASGGDAAEWVAPSKMVPQVAAAIGTLQPGASSGAIAVQGGFAVVHVEDVRYPENAAARASAEARSLDRKQTEALRKLRDELERKYARTDRKLLDALDFEAPKPGFAALAKDRRPLVTFKGEKPITVGEYAQALASGFFHGIEEPIKEKRVNAKKYEALRPLVTKRLFDSEARRRGIPQSAEYRQAIAEFEREQLFGKLVQKAIAPDVKVSEEEGQKYYEAHKAEFSYPGFYKLEGVAFQTSKAAEAALKRLQGGTEFKWVRANAEGQVKLEDQALQLEGTTFSAASLPPELLTILSGAGRNDYRIYQADASQFYVVHVVDVTPPAQQPYAAVREAIGKKLFADNLSKAVKEYAAKLRKAHRVDVYITAIGG